MQFNQAKLLDVWEDSSAKPHKTLESVSLRNSWLYFTIFHPDFIQIWQSLQYIKGWKRKEAWQSSQLFIETDFWLLTVTKQHGITITNASLHHREPLLTQLRHNTKEIWRKGCLNGYRWGWLQCLPFRHPINLELLGEILKHSQALWSSPITTRNQQAMSSRWYGHLC